MKLTGKAKAEWHHTSDLGMECDSKVYRPNALPKIDQGCIEFAEAELSQRKLAIGVPCTKSSPT